MITVNINLSISDTDENNFYTVGKYLYRLLF